MGRKTFAQRTGGEQNQKNEHSRTENNYIEVTNQDATILLSKNEVTQITYTAFKNRAFKKIENGQSILTVSNTGLAVLEVNKALRKLGYNAPEQEMEFTVETQLALAAFQYDRGIIGIPVFDAVTLLKMDEELGELEREQEQSASKNEQASSVQKEEEIQTPPPNEKMRLSVGIVPMDIKSDKEFFNFLDMKIFGKITDINWDIGKNTYKNYIGEETFCQVEIASLKKYLGITDEQWDDMKSKTTSSTTSAVDLRKSIGNYLEKAKEREKAVNDLDILEAKLFGLEELYKEYRAYFELLKLGGESAVGAVMTYKPELDKKAKDNGFEDIQDFENTIKKYLNAFRDETVRLAEDYIDKYEHLLYKEEERLKKDGVLTKLYTAFTKSGAAKKIKDGDSKQFNAVLISGQSNGSTQALKMYDEGKAEMESGIDEVKSLDSFLFKDKTFDYKRLAKVSSQKEFENFLFEFIKSKRESAKNVRKDLKENPDAIYKRQELLEHSYQKQGVVKGSIIDSAIKQKINDIGTIDIFINIGLAIASIIVVVATWGAATPYVIAGTAVSLGMSVYNVYDALDQYSKAHDSYEIGLLKEEPSFAWVVVAIAGAALDVAAFAAVFKLAEPITEVAGVFNKSSKTFDDVKILKESLAKIDGLADKVQLSIVKQAELTVEFRNTAKEFLETAATLNSGINPAAIPKLVRLADLGIKRGALSFRKFLLELKMQNIIKGVDNLTKEELKILKEAFTKAKKGPGLLDEIAESLSLKHKDFLSERNFTIVKRGKSTVNLDVIDDAGGVLFKGTEEHIEKYIAFMSKSASERAAIIKATKTQLKKNTRVVYDPELAKAKGYNVPVSANGTSPDFKGLKMYLNAQGKLGNGKTISGVSKQVFDDALNKIIKFDGEVKVNMTGVRRSDFDNCWKAMGIDPTLGAKLESKLQLTWHHLDDLDENLKGTMQIIRTEAHNKTLPHMGSFVQIENVLNLN